MDSGTQGRGRLLSNGLDSKNDAVAGVPSSAAWAAADEQGTDGRVHDPNEAMEADSGDDCRPVAAAAANWAACLIQGRDHQDDWLDLEPPQ